MKRISKLNRQKLVALGVCVIVAAVGLSLATSSRAATVVVPIEAEQGQLSGNAARLDSQAGASGGSVVKFTAGQPSGGGMSPITVSGNKVMRGGQPWWFLGYNSFTWAGTCGNPMSAAAVDAWFASMRHDGHGMVRLFFFQGWPIDRLDAAVASAKKHNVYLLVSVDNGVGGCGRGPWETSWFSNTSITNAYKDHFRMLLNRYKGETAIAGFEYFNEPAYYDGKLRSFYDEMDGIRDSIDPSRLMSSGTVAPYWLGSEANFANVASSPGVDISSAHEYDWGEGESHQAAAAYNNSAGKPVIVGEFGAINWETECNGKSAAALTRVKAKAEAYSNGKYAGGLAWAWEPGNGSCYGIADDQDIQEAMRTTRQ